MESLLISVVIALAIFGTLFWIISVLPIPEPFGRIAQVVCGVLFLIWLLRLFAPMARI